MKIIIDIDERAYAGCVKLKNNDDMGVLGFHLINATANGTPLEEELEKIRSEIQEEIFNSKGYVTYSNALMRCYEIVDKHISELKGE